MAEIPLKFSIFRYLFGFGITLNAYLVYNRQFPPPAMCLVYYSLCAMCITAVYHLSSHLMRRIPSCGNSLPAFYGKSCAVAIFTKLLREIPRCGPANMLLIHNPAFKGL